MTGVMAKPCGDWQKNIQILVCCLFQFKTASKRIYKQQQIVTFPRQ